MNQFITTNTVSTNVLNAAVVVAIDGGRDLCGLSKPKNRKPFMAGDLRHTEHQLCHEESYCRSSANGRLASAGAAESQQGSILGGIATQVGTGPKVLPMTGTPLAETLGRPLAALSLLGTGMWSPGMRPMSSSPCRGQSL